MTPLVVEQCDPRDHADGIIDLFARHGQPEFAEVFERVYRARADEGLRSWVGFVDGRIVMHISVTPMPVTDGSQNRTIGVLGDLMVEEERRDFWTPLRLVRSMVSDVEEEGGLSYLLTTTVEDAESIFQGVGFESCGVMRRYVIPLKAPYLALMRIVSRAGRSRPVTVRSLRDEKMAELLPNLGSGGRWRPEPSLEYYETRIPRQEFQDGVWIGVGRGGDESTTGWALVSRHGEWPELGLADAFWPATKHGFSEVLHGAARWGRDQGFPRLAVSVVDSDETARLFRRAGLLRRGERTVMLVRPVGQDNLSIDAEEWFLSGLVPNVW